MADFKRILWKNLLQWKEAEERKPLIIHGARQVGKTSLVKQFATQYKQNIILNLEKKSDVSFFEADKDVKDTLEALFLAHKIPFSKANETLLFIDEIQESPAAIKMLRYFYEDYPNLHVIAAGSLLEFTMSKVQSFPVGRVEFLYLHPLNFTEFLQAMEHNSALEQLNSMPLKSFAHKVLMDLFHTYAITGGMPEVLKHYVKTNFFADLPKVYESIWQTYRNDIEKYANNDTERRIVKHIMDSAYLYLDERIKFENFGNSNYRSREIGEAFRNLDDARLIRLIYPTTDTENPPKPDKRKRPRLQFLDTGIVNYKLGIQAQMLSMQNLSNAYKGALIPHLITQELISLSSSSDTKPNFWVREKTQSSAEVDLVFTYNNLLIPIEIKSGSSGTLRSLHQFVEKANHPYAIRIYGGEIALEKAKTPNGKNFILLNLPYYLGTKIPDYIKWLLSK